MASEALSLASKARKEVCPCSNASSYRHAGAVFPIARPFCCLPRACGSGTGTAVSPAETLQVTRQQEEASPPLLGVSAHPAAWSWQSHGQWHQLAPGAGATPASPGALLGWAGMTGRDSGGECTAAGEESGFPSLLVEGLIRKGMVTLV